MTQAETPHRGSIGSPAQGCVSTTGACGFWVGPDMEENPDRGGSHTGRTDERNPVGQQLWLGSVPGARPFVTHKSLPT